jgi:hypothetical protein
LGAGNLRKEAIFFGIFPNVFIPTDCLIHEPFLYPTKNRSFLGLVGCSAGYLPNHSTMFNPSMSPEVTKKFEKHFFLNLVLLNGKPLIHLSDSLNSKILNNLLLQIN